MAEGAYFVPIRRLLCRYSQQPRPRVASLQHVVTCRRRDVSVMRRRDYAVLQN